VTLPDSALVPVGDPLSVAARAWLEVEVAEGVCVALGLTGVELGVTVTLGDRALRAT